MTSDLCLSADCPVHGVAGSYESGRRCSHTGYCPTCAEPSADDVSPYCSAECRHEMAWIEMPQAWINRAVEAYQEAAEWTEEERLSDDAEAAGDYFIGFSVGLTRELTNDVANFIRHNAADLRGLDPAQVGHDFWLTRNGHGAGFWDRGLGELGERLSREARAYGTFDIYLGDDGMGHAS